MKGYCEIKVLGGLPVGVNYVVQGAEPDVGIMNSYLDEYEFVSVKTGKPLGDWVERRLEETKTLDKAIDAINEAIYEAERDYCPLCDWD